MSVIGTVRTWNAPEGWGVIDSPETPGGCWTHFTHITTAGYKSLETGQQVVLEWETGRQEGYDYHATMVTPLE